MTNESYFKESRLLQHRVEELERELSVLSNGKEELQQRLDEAELELHEMETRVIVERDHRKRTEGEEEGQVEIVLEVERVKAELEVMGARVTRAEQTSSGWEQQARQADLYLQEAES